MNETERGPVTEQQRELRERAMAEITSRFSTFGGGKEHGEFQRSPVSEALSDGPAVFSLGVDVGKVVDVVLALLSERREPEPDGYVSQDAADALRFGDQIAVSPAHTRTEEECVGVFLAAPPSHEKLRAALKGLVDALDRCDKDITAVFAFYTVHGNQYGGETYRDELEAAREALEESAVTPPSTPDTQGTD